MAESTQPLACFCGGTLDGSELSRVNGTKLHLVGMDLGRACDELLNFGSGTRKETKSHRICLVEKLDNISLSSRLVSLVNKVF